MAEWRSPPHCSAAAAAAGRLTPAPAVGGGRRRWRLYGCCIHGAFIRVERGVGPARAALISAFGLGSDRGCTCTVRFNSARALLKMRWTEGFGPWPQILELADGGGCAI